MEIKFLPVTRSHSGSDTWSYSIVFLKRLFLFTVLWFFSWGTHAQIYQWGISMGNKAGFDMPNAVVSDIAGNVYVTGSFEDTVDFDPGANNAMLTAADGGDAFIAKYDAAGNYVWAIKIGGEGYEYTLGIDLDKSGNVYVTGYFDGTAYFNDTAATDTLTSAGNDAFLAKYTPDGKYIWSVRMGGSSSDQSAGVKIDTAGNAYIAGYFNSVSADFNPGPDSAILKRAGNYDAFLAKYDPDGKYIWAVSMGGTGTENCYALDIDMAGNAYITGTYNSTNADFNPGPDTALLKRVGSNDIFVGKYDKDGKYIWAFSVGGSGLDQGRGIAVDAMGNVYIAGHFASSVVDFDPGADTSKPRLRTKGSDDIFIAKYDAGGKYVWARNMGGKSIDYCYGLDVNALGNVFITGYYNEEAEFDGITGSTIFKAEGGADMYLARYDADGNFKWAGNMGGPGSETPYGVSVNPRGDIYVAGFFNGTADFDPGPGAGKLTAEFYDVFVAKFICTDTSSSYLDAAECRDTFLLNGMAYTEAGTYWQHFPNVTGCDSTLTISLSFYQVEPVIQIKEFLLSVDNVYATYQWMKNGTDIAGATEATYLVKENGNYQVRVTNERGCPGTAPEYTVSNVPQNGLENIRDLGAYIRVYPNPASKILYISSPLAVQASMYSIEGRHLWHGDNVQTVPLEHLSSGVYLLHIYDNKGNLVRVEKVLKP